MNALASKDLQGEAFSVESLAPEFRLAAACSRWPQNEGDRADIERIATENDIDWSLFGRIVERNQILSLAKRNLGDALSKTGQCDIFGPAKAVGYATKCLSQAAELVRIGDAAKEGGLEVIALKGVVLSVVAYGHLALRSPGDIDLLVDPANVLDLERVLLKLGYIRYEPGARLTPKRLTHYLKYYKHFAYFSETRNIALEVHWRLFHNNHLTQPDLQRSKTIQVPIGSGVVSTLSRPELVLYLCVHGAIHGWPVLKWLADIGALLRSMTEDDLREVVSLASERGLTSQLQAMMLLVDHFLAIDHPSIDIPRTNAAVVKRIVSMAHRLLTGNDYCLAIDDFPRFGMFLYDIGIGPSWRYRVEDIRRALVFPDDWERLDLPDSLFPLYVAVRPVSWMMRHLSRVPKRLFGMNHRPLSS